METDEMSRTDEFVWQHDEDDVDDDDEKKQKKSTIRSQTHTHTHNWSLAEQLIVLSTNEVVETI